MIRPEPYEIRIALNGREWLGQSPTKAGCGYSVSGNKILHKSQKSEWAIRIGGYDWAEITCFLLTLRRIHVLTRMKLLYPRANFKRRLQKVYLMFLCDFLTQILDLPKDAQTKLPPTKVGGFAQKCASD